MTDKENPVWEYYFMEGIGIVRRRLGSNKGREHVASADCWCGPAVDYKDPETGAAVFVHKDVQ